MANSLGLASGAGWAAGGETLDRILSRQFNQNAATRELELRAQQLAQQQGQFDASMGLNREQFEFDKQRAMAPPEPKPMRTIELKGVLNDKGQRVTQVINQDTQEVLIERPEFQAPDKPQAMQTIELKGVLNDKGQRVTQVLNPDTREVIFERPEYQEPKPGGPTAATVAADQNKLDEVDQAMTTIDTLEKHPGLFASVGFKGPTNYLPGTNAADFNAYFDALKAQLTFPNLQKMRGLGAMSNIEFSTLQKAATALDRSMTEESFLTELGNIRTNLKKIQDRIKRGVRVDPNTGAEIGGVTSGAPRRGSMLTQPGGVTFEPGGGGNVPGAALPGRDPRYRKIGGR